MRHICYTLVTLSLSTLATLFLHNIGNQKCATFVTLWLHFPFPHLHSTSGTLSYTTLVIKNASPLLHFHCTLLVQTFTTHFPNYLSTIHKACPKPLFSFCSSGHPLQLLSQGPLLLKDPKRGSGSTPSVMEG